METLLQAIAGQVMGSILGRLLYVIWGGILVYVCGAGVLGLHGENASMREAPEVYVAINGVFLVVGLIFLCLGLRPRKSRQS